jgi:exoribonuclease R
MAARAPSIDLVAAAERALVEHGFEPAFPLEVQREVAALDRPRSAWVGNGIRDLRDLLWSSIDNRESRDLDQVEFTERLPGDGIRVLVGIADVDTLVAKGSATDQHAATNTTSVYAGVAVFPMLPERLCTDLTSLNEGEDRPAVVVQMDVAPDGVRVAFDAFRALLRNHARLDYDSVGAWLEGWGPVPDAVARTPGLEAQLRLQDEAAGRLRELRRRSGALSVETVEPRAVASNGQVIDIKAVERNRARELIEAYMVAANTTTAAFLLENEIPSIRRVVRAPRRWDRIIQLASDLGERLPAEPSSVALSEFLARRRAADPEHFPDLSLAVIKMLGAGEYVLERRLRGRRYEGHFGLAVADYVHSTAPNRRFVDLVTQRLVKSAEGAGPAPYADGELAEIARRCTVQEDAARKVERLMRKRAAAVFFAERVGDSFTAIVTGASAKGTYVRVLAPPVEGRVVRGQRGLDVGDTVRVRLVATDPERGYIDFEVPHPGNIARKLERSRRKRAAAELLRRRVGETFIAEVTGASPKGTYVRLVDAPAEGRVTRGHSPLRVGMRIPVTLIATDTVHGFIDFAYTPGLAPHKAARAERKRAWAARLRRQVGERFDAVVAGVNPKATYVRLLSPGVEGLEGRLVRGTNGLSLGDTLRVALLEADPRRGFIDFARDD